MLTYSPLTKRDPVPVKVYEIQLCLSPVTVALAASLTDRFSLRSVLKKMQVGASIGLASPKPSEFSDPVTVRW
jgi:hypothetical protein